MMHNVERVNFIMLKCSMHIATEGAADGDYQKTCLNPRIKVLSFNRTFNKGIRSRQYQYVDK